MRTSLRPSLESKSEGGGTKGWSEEAAEVQLDTTVDGGRREGGGTQGWKKRL